jgi:nicotinate-nucleotide pyrophosphorylase (carboxylating)
VVRLHPDEIRSAVQAALAEDLGDGDATTLATVPESAVASAVMRARQALTLAGVEFAVQAFQALSDGVTVRSRLEDGTHARAGEVLLTLSGPTRALLSGERVALNFLQRLSGVATLTTRFVEAVSGTPAKILDTRKTTPGWRRFEKYAVACGGGLNHRRGLFDQILIKDNHLAALQGATAGPIASAVRLARTAYPQLKLEVEADTLDQVAEAVAAGADCILLDNMSCEQLGEAVQRVAGRCRLEASGGVTLETVRDIARTGVDFISVGALTHSAPAVDIGLDFEDAPSS